MKKYLLIITLLATIFTSTNIIKAQNIATLRSSITPGFEFKMDLRLGDTDPAVRELQRVLNTDIDTMIVSDGPGSRGKETTYFGEATKSAVIRFQHKYRNTVLTPNGYTMGHGNVDKATRTRLNLLIGVITTYDSTGLPQSRAGSTVSTPTPTYTPPVSTPNPTVTKPQMTTCQFIELLINIKAIAPNKADAGRRVFNCPIVSTQTEPIVVYVPASVTLKVNNQTGFVSIPTNSNVTVSWSASGVDSCRVKAGNQNITNSLNAPSSNKLNGSVNYTVGTTNQTLTMSCQTVQGDTISSSVLISVTNPVSDNLQAICNANPINTVVDNPILWNAQVTGGSDYTYLWSGTDDLSGNTQNITKTYLTPGTKNAQLIVMSGSASTTVNCTMSVNAPIPTPPTPIPIPTPTPTPTPTSTPITSTSTIQINLLVNGQTENANVNNGLINLSWSSNADYCLATSTPISDKWQGFQSNNGFSQIDIFSSPAINYSAMSFGSYTASIYSKDGQLLESAVSLGGSNGYASTIRFKKKGGEYPKDSYVLLGEGSKCYIPDGSKKVTSCVTPPATNLTIDIGITCGKYSTNDTNTKSITVNATSAVINNSLNTKFLWKPISEGDSKLVILYGDCMSPECMSEEEDYYASDDKIKDLDAVLFNGISVPCGTPLTSISVSGYSVEKRRFVRYIWKIGESKLDIHALIGGGNAGTGPVGYNELEIGEEETCRIGGKAPVILKAYGLVSSLFQSKLTD